MYNRIYKFSAAHCDWLKEYETNDISADPKEQKRILGGKGSALVDMCAMGLPVPPGFTITTEVCSRRRVRQRADD